MNKEQIKIFIDILTFRKNYIRDKMKNIIIDYSILKNNCKTCFYFDNITNIYIYNNNRS